MTMNYVKKPTSKFTMEQIADIAKVLQKVKRKLDGKRDMSVYFLFDIVVSSIVNLLRDGHEDFKDNIFYNWVNYIYPDTNPEDIVKPTLPLGKE